MCPTLNEGDYVLIKLTRGAVPAIGSIVVAQHPVEDRIVIKRVRSLGKSAAFLGSDNPAEGTDSRHFGSVAFTEILGPVVQARIDRQS